MSWPTPRPRGKDAPRRASQAQDNQHQRNQQFRLCEDAGQQGASDGFAGAAHQGRHHD